MSATEVDVPAVGRVPKQAAIAGGIAVVGIVGWAYLRAARRKKADAAAAAAATAPNSDYGTPDVLPVVPPGAPGGFGNVNGSTNVTPPAGAITDNAAWSAAVRDRMAGTYPDNVVVDALGAFLNRQPLNDQQMKVIQAAIAVAGYPPVGDLHMISGSTSTGTPPMLVAPSNIQAINITSSGYLITWSPVPGALTYKVYEGPYTTPVSDTNCGVQNRGPGDGATFQISAVSPTGAEGPKSAPVTFYTQAAAPAPAPAPAPSPQPSAPAPAPGPAYPAYHFSHTNQAGDNYSSIAARYGLNISGQELYQYQFSPEAGRPVSTQATLRQRGATIYAGGETEIPYPRR